MKGFVRQHWLRLVVAVSVAVYLRFLLIPTAVVFYELYHLIDVAAVYWGYSLFKFAGYYFGNSPFQSVTCIGIAALIATPWRRIYRSLRTRTATHGASV